MARQRPNPRLLPRILKALALLLVLTPTLAACGGGGTGGQPVLQTLVYTALGASDAVGIGATPRSNGYVFRIEARMNAVGAETTLHNLGINGARIEDLLADELPIALTTGPDVITVWTGSNDVIGGADPDDFADGLDLLLRELTTKTVAQVFVGDLVDLTEAPLFRANPDPDVTPARVAAFNERIVSAVQEHGCTLVRLSAVPLTDDMFWIDGFHPNDEGHARLATAFWAEIASRL